MEETKENLRYLATHSIPISYKYTKPALTASTPIGKLAETPLLIQEQGVIQFTVASFEQLAKLTLSTSKCSI